MFALHAIVFQVKNLNQQNGKLLVSHSFSHFYVCPLVNQQSADQQSINQHTNQLNQSFGQ